MWTFIDKKSMNIHRWCTSCIYLQRAKCIIKNLRKALQILQENYLCTNKNINRIMYINQGPKQIIKLHTYIYQLFKNLQSNQNCPKQLNFLTILISSPFLSLCFSVQCTLKIHFQSLKFYVLCTSHP